MRPPAVQHTGRIHVGVRVFHPIGRVEDFAEQIIAPLALGLQQFLEETSVLEDLSPQRCNVLRQTSDASAFLAEITRRRHGRLRLGSFPTALATFVPAVLARFQEREPDATLRVIDDHMQRLLPRLEDGELDVAIVYDDPSTPLASTASSSSQL